MIYDHASARQLCRGTRDRRDVIGQGGGRTSQFLRSLDGELEAEIAFGTAAVQSGGTKTGMGKAGDGLFDGLIDEVLIYNRALSEEEVVQNFESEVFHAVKP